MDKRWIVKEELSKDCSGHSRIKEYPGGGYLLEERITSQILSVKFIG
jgi:hypothetical protein